MKLIEEMKNAWALVPTATAIEEKLASNNIYRQVRAFTGFDAVDARILIDLLLRWHYVSQDDATRLKLASFGVKVSKESD
jgi:hypothetical protein